MNSSSLKTKTSKLLVIGVAVLAFLGALLGLSLQNNSSKVHAENTTPPSTVDITVHKLQYTGKAPSIDNDGSKKVSLPSTVSAYDPSKYGDVGFTVYDITKAVSSKYSTDGLTNGDISEIVKNASTYETVANKVRDQKDVGTDGTVTFSDLPNYSSSQNHHVYLIAETKSSKLIKTTAQPMVVVTPMTNSNGDGYLSTVNVYPKNEIQTLSFTLTKQAEKNGQSAAALAGAKFLLYKGTPGSGTQVTKVELKTDANGKITATNLTVGSYYFVEEASDNVSTDGSKGAGYLLGKDALNDKNNKLTFTIDSDGTVTPTDKTYINYQKPASTKTVTNGSSTGSSTDKSFDQGATVNYQATITVPNNISDYTEFNWVDTPGTGLKYSSDTAFTLTYGDSVDGTQTALTKSTDYNLTYDTDNKTYKIDFLDSSNKLLNSSLAGKVVKISYSMALDPTTAKVATGIDNNYTLNWDNGTGKHTNTGTATVYTYGAKFIKKSAGILGTGINNSALSGAEFVVTNSNGKYLNQKDGTSNWVSSQDHATVFTSGTDGTFSVKGLAKGTYSLKEIKAPTGYQLRTSDLSFTVDESSNSKTIEVDDNAKGLLSTGSQWLMLIIALVIVIGTTLGVKEYRKARKVNA